MPLTLINPNETQIEITVGKELEKWKRSKKKSKKKEFGIRIYITCMYIKYCYYNIILIKLLYAASQDDEEAESDEASLPSIDHRKLPHSSVAAVPSSLSSLSSLALPSSTIPKKIGISYPQKKNPAEEKKIQDEQKKQLFELKAKALTLHSADYVGDAMKYIHDQEELTDKQKAVLCEKHLINPLLARVFCMYNEVQKQSFITRKLQLEEEE